MTKLANDNLLKMYYTMVLTRHFEDVMGPLFHNGTVAENFHRCYGQEAVGVGATFALGENDILLPSLRSRSAYFAKGVDLKTMLMAVYRRADSPASGKESSHHMGIPELGILLTSAFIGSHITVAPGVALKAKILGTDQVTLCIFGDGATSRGDFHEGLNLAAVLDLPVVFLCENNEYAWSTPHANQMKIEDVAIKAEGYGMPGVIVDGQDILKVNEAVQDAVDRARKGLGPTLIECKTYRFAGHSELSPNWDEGRPKDELEHWRSRDPIKLFEDYLMKHEVLTDSIKEEYQQEIERDLKEAIAHAEQSPDPTEEDLLTNVYA